MNVLITLRQTQIIAASMSGGFLLIHVAMLVLFLTCGVTPMVWFNVFSIAFYLASLLLIRRQMFRAYVVAVYLEVLAHMVSAVVLTGWDAGFQITLIGMNVMAFFQEYIGRSMPIKHVSGVPLCVAGMLGYLGALLYTHYVPPAYPLPAEVAFWLQVAWGIVVFSITVTFLHFFVLVTFESEKVMSLQLSHDQLTGLPNRYHMSDFLRRAQEEGGLEGRWVAMLDIDDFKNVNDSFGHNCGDYVLGEVARLLKECRGVDELCRWGGEEFLMVGRVGQDASAHLAALEQTRRTVEEFGFWYEEQRLRLTVTAGVACYEEGMSTSEWINLADKRLYAGKQAGKNQVVS